MKDMIAIFKKDSEEFLAKICSFGEEEFAPERAWIVETWADETPGGFDLLETFVNPFVPAKAMGVEFVGLLHERSLLELTGDELTARHAKFQLAAMYSEADRETFIICLFQNWVRWDGTHFVFLSPDPTEPGLYGRGVSRRLGEMYLLSRLIECENDTFRFASPEAAEAREEYLRLLGGIE